MALFYLLTIIIIIEPVTIAIHLNIQKNHSIFVITLYSIAINSGCKNNLLIDYIYIWTLYICI